jgi:hypothetical protein
MLCVDIKSAMYFMNDKLLSGCQNCTEPGHRE